MEICRFASLPGKQGFKSIWRYTDTVYSIVDVMSMCSLLFWKFLGNSMLYIVEHGKNELTNQPGKVKCSLARV